jgi:hypothetical protein
MIASMVQTHGPSQGWLYDRSTMRDTLDTAATREWVRFGLMV